MIYTSPISQYNMQNAQQLGQIMQGQEAYTPAINPFARSDIPPAGYSMYQWQQELSLARSEYMTRPAYAAAHFMSTAAYYPAIYTPFTSQILPRVFGATAVDTVVNGIETTRFVGGNWAATKLGNLAMGAHDISSALTYSIGKRVGGAIGNTTANASLWTLNKVHGAINAGGALTEANNFIGSTTQQLFGKSLKFNNTLAGYIDKGAGKLAGVFSDFSRGVSTLEATQASIIKQMAKATTQAEKIKLAADLKKTGDALLAARTAKAAATAKGLVGATEAVGGTVLGFASAIFNPIFLLKQAVLDKIIDYGMESYENYSTRTELERELLAKGGRVLRFGDASFETGIDGGFTKAQRQHIVRHLDRMAARDPRVRAEDWFNFGSWSPFGGHSKYSENLKELKAILSVSTDMGMLDMSKSLDEVEKRFDSIVKVVKKLSRITGKSKGELTMALANTQQIEGRFNIVDAGRSLERKMYSAYATGADLQTVLQEAALGAQMGMQAGIGKAAGSDFMILSRNIFGRMYRRGMMDRGDIDMMGGEQGVVSNLASGMISMANNNVFKSTMAMLFDPKTGKLNQNRLDMYLKGDSKTLASFMKDRNVLMGTESYNKMSGLMEIGGVLNEKMPYVQYALQHGDISQDIILKVARRELKAAELLYGTEKAKARTQWNMINTFGAEKGMLLFKALSDPSLLKADLKESFAVTRKQLEDRYAAEMERALGTGFYKNMAVGGWGAFGGLLLGAKYGAALGLGAGLPGMVLGGAIGAGVGFVVNAGLDSIFDFENRYLGWGKGALTPKMKRIHALRDRSWLWWNNQSGIEKYNEGQRLLYFGLTSKNVNIKNLTKEEEKELNEKSKHHLTFFDLDRLMKDNAKTNEDGTKVNDTKYEDMSDTERAAIDFISGKITRGDFRQIVSEKIDEDLAPHLAGIIRTARESYIAKNLDKNEKEIRIGFLKKLNEMRDIYLDETKSDDGSWSLDSAETYKKISREKYAEETGANIADTWNIFNLSKRTYVGKSYNDQMEQQKALASYLMDISTKGDKNNPIYQVLEMTPEQVKEYIRETYYKGRKDLTAKEEVALSEKTRATIAEGERRIADLPYFYERGSGNRLEDNEYVELSRRVLNKAKKDASLITGAELEEFSRFAARDHNLQNEDLYKGKNAGEIYKAFDAARKSDKIGDYVEGLNRFKKEKGEGLLPDNDEDATESATGGSVFNKELLEVLKGIKVTMDNLNVTLGGSSVPQYTAYR